MSSNSSVSVFMLLAFSILTSVAAVQHDVRRSPSLVEQFPFFHDSQQLDSEVARLSENCGGRMEVTKQTDGDVSIDLIRIKGDAKTANNRMFIASGEHARELIGSESVLYFLRAICGDVKLHGKNRSVAKVLAKTDFAVVLNANPLSRLKVDEGDFCVRENPNGIDLNRNWDTHWENNFNVGSEPFSEPEARLLRDMMTEFKPNSYLSVHSGTFGLYMPWAYTTSGDLADRNQKQMLSILQEVDQVHCQCPFGAAGKEVGYACPGTSVDWAYDKLKAQYSFAWEIWVTGGREALTERWNEQKASSSALSLLQLGGGMSAEHMLADKRWAEFFRQHPSDFVGLQTNASVSSESKSSFDCFTQYNPQTQEEYDEAVENWATAFVDMSLLVSHDLAAQDRARF